MNPAALLIKVTARAAPFEIVPSSFQRISPEDVSHALGLIKHDGASLLIRVKWAGQAQFIQDLDIKFWLAIVALSNFENWPYPEKFKGEELYRNMGRLALSESIDPNICLECGGSAIEITPEGRIEKCSPCRGTGKSHHSERSRARILGMAWETYRHVWNDRYRKIQGMVDLWESIGLSVVANRTKIA
jgi:hypothetical protein